MWLDLNLMILWYIAGISYTFCLCYYFLCVLYMLAYVWCNDHVNSCLHIDFFSECRPHIHQPIHCTQKVGTFVEQTSDFSCVMHLIFFIFPTGSVEKDDFYCNNITLSRYQGKRAESFALQRLLWMPNSVHPTHIPDGSALPQVYTTSDLYPRWFSTSTGIHYIQLISQMVQHLHGYSLCPTHIPDGSAFRTIYTRLNPTHATPQQHNTISKHHKHRPDSKVWSHND